MKLPTQEVNNLLALSNEQLQHEYDLSFEVLNGIYIDGQLVIKGMLFENIDEYPNRDQFLLALNHWKKRLERATDELMERAIFSESKSP